MLKSRTHKKKHSRSFDRLSAPHGQARDGRALDDEIAAVIRQASFSPSSQAHELPPKNNEFPNPSPHSPGSRQADEPSAGQCLWIPQGKALKSLPADVRQAVAEILDPTYRELVLDAPTAMEKSLGTSMVRLVWLEILDQHKFTIDEGHSEMFTILGGDLDKAIDRCMKLVNAKLRIGNVLLRLREQRLKNSQNPQKTWPSPEGLPPIPPKRPFGDDAERFHREFDQAFAALQAGEARTPPSPTPETSSPQPQTCKNQEMAPKSQIAPQNSALKTGNSNPETQDPALNVENHRIDNQNLAPSAPESPSPNTQDPSPSAQNSKSVGENRNSSPSS